MSEEEAFPAHGGMCAGRWEGDGVAHQQFPETTASAGWAMAWDEAGLARL